MLCLYIIQRFIIIISEQGELDSHLRIRMFAFHKGGFKHANQSHQVIFVFISLGHLHFFLESVIFLNIFDSYKFRYWIEKVLYLAYLIFD